MKDTILIIGNSPFLSETESFIHYLVDKYPSIGINNIIKKLNVQIHAFVDMGMINVTNQYPETKTISLRLFGDLVQKENKELIDTFTFDFNKDTEDTIFKDNKLAWCGFTHDFALSYAITKGWKNIVLIGAADFINGDHYTPDGKFRYSQTLREQSTRFISEVCTKRANIYTCNPNSPLKVQYISPEDLLKNLDGKF